MAKKTRTRSRTSRRKTCSSSSRSPKKSVLDLQAIAEGAKDELARRDSNAFCERVIKDDKGCAVSLSEIHREMNFHIDECRRLGLNCGILAPWRHGKTESVVIGRTLQFIAENVNNRVFIVCNSDDNSASRVSSVSKYIKEDSDYKRIYPHVVPTTDEWGKHKLVVQRQTKIKDGTVEAYGITTSGTGGGCDFLIVDDPVDLRNAILNPALRIQVKESFRNVWSSRVASNGFKIYIATMWHNDDLTSELLKNPEWCFLIIKVSEDFSCFDCESPLKGKFRMPLWSLWPRERLIQRCKEIGKRAFNRGFRQDALSDDEKTFPSALSIFKYGVRVNDVVSPEWPRVMGIDPFGQKVVIHVLAYSPEGKRYPVEIRKGKWQPKETVDNLIDCYRIHRPQLIVCENNASQDAIVQWVKERDNTQLPIIGFCTGANKADPNVGLKSLEVEFSNGSWIVCMGDKEHEPDCDCGLCDWKNELNSHPVGVTADSVMASWFAREAVRALLLPIEDNKEEIITEEEAGLERVSMGDY